MVVQHNFLTSSLHTFEYRHVCTYIFSMNDEVIHILFLICHMATWCCKKVSYLDWSTTQVWYWIDIRISTKTCSYPSEQPKLSALIAGYHSVCSNGTVELLEIYEQICVASCCSDHVVRKKLLVCSWSSLSSQDVSSITRGRITFASLHTCLFLGQIGVVSTMTGCCCCC